LIAGTDRFELTDFECSIIAPLLPNKPRGVPRVDDLNGIYWRLRTGSPWADIPERYGPATTRAHHFRRWGQDRGGGTGFSPRSRSPMTAICE
jgi:transposase